MRVRLSLGGRARATAGGHALPKDELHRAIGMRQRCDGFGGGASDLVADDDLARGLVTIALAGGRVLADALGAGDCAQAAITRRRRKIGTMPVGRQLSSGEVRTPAPR